MAEEWGQENGGALHSSDLILLPVEIPSGQSLWLGIQVGLAVFTSAAVSVAMVGATMVQWCEAESFITLC